METGNLVAFLVCLLLIFILLLLIKESWILELGLKYHVIQPPIFTYDISSHVLRLEIVSIYCLKQKKKTIELLIYELFVDIEMKAVS